MEQSNMTSLREILEQMSTDQLEQMLHSELKKERPDGDAVRLIMRILKERDSQTPTKLTPEKLEAWEKYQVAIEKETPHKKKRWMPLLRAASILLALGLTLAIIPTQVQARNLFERLFRWTDSVMEFFSPGEETTLYEYEFQTENPGLQQLYDTYVEYGGSGPMVPMWLPGEPELIDCEVDELPGQTNITGIFYGETGESVIIININDKVYYRQYYKNDPDPELIELYGNIHNVARNMDRWAVTWNKDNIECYVILDCQKDILNKVLKSIYVMEA